MNGGREPDETVPERALRLKNEDEARKRREREEIERRAREAEEAARKEREAKEAAHQERMRKASKHAAQELSKWHENYNKSSCNIMGGRGRIKNTFRKKNKSYKIKSKRVNKRIKINKRYSRKSSRKSLKK
jgi:hypothetical protein